jgi:uncharacterized Zn-finger protein
MLQGKIEFPLDSDGFFRRECPNCEREFKLQILEKDNFSQEVTPQEEKKDEIICPYCNQVANIKYWWTKAQANYLSEKTRYEATSFLKEKFMPKIKSSRHVKVTVTHSNLPVPYIEPERNDMKLVSVICCERNFKVLDDWKDTVCCPDCGKIYNV